MSNILFPIKIALRYLFYYNADTNTFSKDIQTNIISALTIIISVTTLITVSAVMEGFSRELKKTMIDDPKTIIIKGPGAKYNTYPQQNPNNNRQPTNNNTHPKSPYINNYKEIISTMSQINNIKTISPIINKPAFIISRKNTAGINIIGTNKEYLQQTENIKIKINSEKYNGIFISEILALRLGVHTNDYIKITLGNKKSRKINIQKIKISGIFSTKNNLHDSTIIYTTIDTIQRLLNKPVAVELINIYVKDESYVDTTKGFLRQNYKNLKIYSWEDRNNDIVNALEIEKNSMTAILLLMFILSSFSISSNLTLIISRKIKSIAIFKAMGVSNMAIVFIFIIYNLIINTISITIGSITGIAIASNIKNIYNFIKNFNNIAILNPLISFLEFLPSYILKSDITLIIQWTFIISFIATIIPAINITKTDINTSLN